MARERITTSRLLCAASRRSSRESLAARGTPPGVSCGRLADREAANGGGEAACPAPLAQERVSASGPTQAYARLGELMTPAERDWLLGEIVIQLEDLLEAGQHSSVQVTLHTQHGRYRRAEVGRRRMSPGR